MPQIKRFTKVILALNLSLVLTYLIISSYHQPSNEPLQKDSFSAQIPKVLPKMSSREPNSTVFQNHIPLSKIVLNAPHACVNSSTKTTSMDIVIIVLSARANFLQRRLIRESWGSVKSYRNVTVTAVVFMLGHIGSMFEQANVSERIELESAAYRDIVTGNFIDTYRNLSRKAILAYEWISTYCITPDIVVKTDDDVMVNIFELARELEVIPVLKSDVIHCLIHYKELPIRERTPGLEIYYVSYDEIPGQYFPDHCAGVGYPIRMNLARRLVTGMIEEPHMVTHEDVYITGILPGRLNNGSDDKVVRVDRRDKWYKWHDNGGVSNDTLFKLNEERKYNAKDVREIFHRAYGTILFYLIVHGDTFESEFKQLWARVLVDTLTKRW